MSFLVEGLIQAKHMLCNKLGELKGWNDILLVRANSLRELPPFDFSELAIFLSSLSCLDELVSVSLGALLLVWFIFVVVFLLVFITIVIILVVVADDIVLIDLLVALLHDEVSHGVKDLVAEVLCDQLRDKVVVIFLLDVVYRVHEIGDRLFLLRSWLVGSESEHGLCCLLVLFLLALGLTLPVQLLVMPAHLEDEFCCEVEELLLGDGGQVQHYVPSVVDS